MGEGKKLSFPSSFPGFVEYRRGELYIEEVAARDLVVQHGTPVIAYSASRVADTAHQLRTQLSGLDTSFTLAYAYKACYFSPVTSLIAQAGLTAEVMSVMEWLLACRAGFDPARLVVNGPGKSAAALRMMLEGGTEQFNVDSIDDLLRLNEVAAQLNAHPRVLIRIHVDCDDDLFVGGGTKLGFDILSGEAVGACRLASSLPHVSFVGLSAHVFSRETSANRFLKQAREVISFARSLQNEADTIKVINLGGGFDSRYLMDCQGFDMRAFAQELSNVVCSFRKNLEVQLEPGRYVVGDSAVGIGQIISTKQSRGFPWLILDLATNTLIPTPSARFQVAPVRPSQGPLINVGVADGVCSTANVIQPKVLMPEPKTGDHLAVFNCGAYAAVMSEAWTFPQAPVVLIQGNTIKPVFTRDQSCSVVQALYGIDDPRVFN